MSEHAKRILAALYAVPIEQQSEEARIAAIEAALAPPAQTQQELSGGVAWSISGGGHDKRSVEIVTPDGDVVAEVFGSPAHLETAQQRAEAICAARRPSSPDKQLELSEEEVEAQTELDAIDDVATGARPPEDFEPASGTLGKVIRLMERRANNAEHMTAAFQREKQLRTALERLLEVAQRQWDEKPAKASDINRLDEARALLNLEKQPSPAAAPAQLSEAIDALAPDTLDLKAQLEAERTANRELASARERLTLELAESRKLGLQENTELGEARRKLYALEDENARLKEAAERGQRNHTELRRQRDALADENTRLTGGVRGVVESNTLRERSGWSCSTCMHHTEDSDHGGEEGALAALHWPHCAVPALRDLLATSDKQAIRQPRMKHNPQGLCGCERCVPVGEQ